MQKTNESGKADQIQKSTKINDLIPDEVLRRIYSFIKNSDLSDLNYNQEMVNEIERYIDINSLRWIYYPILRNRPESRYAILLLHYFDRRPSDQVEINSLLPPETLDQISEMKKSFKLGC
ncbi:MAG: hypothetical protein ACW99A_05050 [Candidatus Kariarchaeaceae archaeon]